MNYKTAQLEARVNKANQKIKILNKITRYMSLFHWLIKGQKIIFEANIYLCTKLESLFTEMWEASTEFIYLDKAKFFNKQKEFFTTLKESIE